MRGPRFIVTAPIASIAILSNTTNQEAIIRLFKIMNRYVGNLPSMPGVFRDYSRPPTEISAWLTESRADWLIRKSRRQSRSHDPLISHGLLDALQLL